MQAAAEFESVIKRLALAYDAFVLLPCLAILVGWAFEIESFKSILPNEPVITSSVAIGMTACCIAAGLYFLGKPWSQMLARILAFAILASGIAVIAESGLEADWGLNHIWWQPVPEARGLEFPAPMSPQSALMLILISGAILTKRLILFKRFDVSQAFSVASLALCSMLFCGQVSGVEKICSIAIGGCLRLVSPMQCALALLLTYTVSIVDPRQGAMSILCSPTRGGRLARRTGLIVLSLPLLIVLRSAGMALDWWDSAFGLGVIVVIFVAITGALFANQVLALDESEKARMEAEEKLKGARLFSMEDTVGGELDKTKAPASPTNSQSFRNVCLECGATYADGQARCPIDNAELKLIKYNNAPGSSFAERYTIVSKLGEGGMSTVYKAEHTLLKTFVALKMLRGNLSDDIDSLKRFQREARATAGLSHPNLIAVKDFGVTGDGTPFIVMEYLDGVSLSDFIKRNGRVSQGQAVSWFHQIASGLAVAHGHSIVHRDLKPSNIMILGLDEQVVKIVDFGLAKSKGDMQVTATGAVFGSPLYMSPEQCMGRSLDHRSDIYSFGCLMYEALTGMPPFKGDNIFEIIHKHTGEAVQPIDPSLDLPQWLTDMVMLTLEKDIEKRTQSAAEIQACIEQNAGITFGGISTQKAKCSESPDVSQRY